MRLSVTRKPKSEISVLVVTCLVRRIYGKWKRLLSHPSPWPLLPAIPGVARMPGLNRPKHCRTNRASANRRSSYGLHFCEPITETSRRCQDRSPSPRLLGLMQ